MAMNRRTRLVYGVLLAVWALLLAWQGIEHRRVEAAERAKLRSSAKLTTTTVGLVLRSQSRFGIISKDRLESALASLLNPSELTAVAMRNAAGEVVASAGSPIDFDVLDRGNISEHWGANAVTLLNLVDLGTNLTSEAEGARPTIVLPRSEIFPPFGTNRFGTNRPPGPRPPPSEGSDRPPGPRPPEGREHPPGPPPPDSFAGPPGTNDVSGTNAPPRSRRREGRPPFGRPHWMSEEEYKAALQKQGVHSFVIVLPTASMQTVVQRDLWLRLSIAGLASLSFVGLGLAWRNLARSAELELRLVRAAELNTRLKEMNFAAAGLAHETKNPLNIIRGLAQMIAKQEDAAPEIRQKSRGIVDEADRVTAQLNEFINFSRPREVRRVNVPLAAVLAEISRALSHDLDDKALRLTVAEGLPSIEADEQLLRQALFNLLLNATQAVERNGEIQVAAARTSATEAALEIRDNGPGVPPENRTDIFKPYFTTNQKGTGLGLAVVQQIVLAHGWEIECLPNQPRGAVFRISHLRVAASA
jgi:signal transduction histidine kinase